MKLHFHKVRWKNFLSTGNEFNEIDLDTTAMTLIVGKNGSGKSTLLDALLFVLFNKMFRKMNRAQIPNSVTKKNCVVECEFSKGNDKYLVRRGISPNVFEVFVNDELINQDAKALDYQTQFEKNILRVNLKAFCQTVILGSAAYVPFMQLSTPDRRVIVEDLLDMQIFTIMNSLLTDKKSKNDKLILENEKKIAVIEGIIRTLKSSLDNQKTANDEVIKEKNDLIRSSKLEIETLTEELKDLQKVSEQIQTEISGMGKVETALRQYRDFHQQFVSKVNGYKSEINFLATHDDCPTCKQIIDSSFKETVVNSKKSSITEVDSAILKVKKHIEIEQAKLDNFTTKQRELTSIMLDQNTITTKISSLDRYLKSLSKDIEELSKQKVITNEKQQIENSQVELLELRTTLSELKIQKDIYDIQSKTILKDTGVKSELINDFIPKMNELINQYLKAMDFFVEFNFNGNFEEVIRSRFRDEFTYNSFSQGQKLRMDLAILFTWREIAKIRSSFNTNLLVLDEVLDGSLDFDGIEDFMKIITQLTSGTNTFIISPKGENLFDKFDRMIVFRDDKNFSKMSVEENL